MRVLGSRWVKSTHCGQEGDLGGGKYPGPVAMLLWPDIKIHLQPLIILDISEGYELWGGG